MQRSKDRRLTTHSVRQLPVARFFIVPFHIGWHLAHHVDAGVPMANLPKLHTELAEAGYVSDALEYRSYPALWRKLASGTRPTATHDPGADVSRAGGAHAPRRPQVDGCGAIPSTTRPCCPCSSSPATRPRTDAGAASSSSCATRTSATSSRVPIVRVGRSTSACSAPAAMTTPSSRRASGSRTTSRTCRCSSSPACTAAARSSRPRSRRPSTRSVFPAVQNLLLAAGAHGLGASATTLPLWSAWEARRTLGLPRRVTPVAVVALGWPRGGTAPHPIPPVGNIVHLDRFGHQPFRARPRPTGPDTA